TVAGDLRIPARSGPSLSGFDEPAAPTSLSQVRVDVPAFDVADGRRLASVRILPCSGFEEPAKPAITPIDDENRLRLLVCPEIGHVHLVGLGGKTRPQDVTHPHPFGAVVSAHSSDVHGLSL